MLLELQILTRPVHRHVVHDLVFRHAGNHHAIFRHAHMHRIHGIIALMLRFRQRVLVLERQVFELYQTLLIGSRRPGHVLDAFRQADTHVRLTAVRDRELDTLDRAVRQLAVLVELQIALRPLRHTVIDHTAGRQTGNQDIAMIVIIDHDRQRLLHADIVLRSKRLGERIAVVGRDIRKFHRAIRRRSHRNAVFNLLKSIRPSVALAVCAMLKLELRASQTGVGVVAELLEGDLRHMILRRLVGDRRIRSHRYIVDLHTAHIHTDGLFRHVVIALVLRLRQRVGVIHRQILEHHHTLRIGGRRQRGCDAFRLAAAIRAGVTVLERKHDALNRIPGLFVNLLKGQILRRPVDQIIVKDVLAIHRQTLNLRVVVVRIDIHPPRTCLYIVRRGHFAEQIAVAFGHIFKLHQTLRIGGCFQIVIDAGQLARALAIVAMLQRELHARERALRVGAVLVEAQFLQHRPLGRHVVDRAARHALHQHIGSGGAHGDRIHRRIVIVVNLRQRITVHRRDTRDRHRAVRTGVYRGFQLPFSDSSRKLVHALRRILAGIAVHAVMRQHEANALDRRIVHRAELLKRQAQLRPFDQVIVDNAVVRRQAVDHLFAIIADAHRQNHRLHGGKALGRARFGKDVSVVRRHIQKFHQAVYIRDRRQRLCKARRPFAVLASGVVMRQREDRARQRRLHIAVVLEEADLRHSILGRLVHDLIAIHQAAAARNVLSGKLSLVLAHHNRPRTGMQISFMLGFLKDVGMLYRQAGEFHLAVRAGSRSPGLGKLSARLAATVRAIRTVLQREFDAGDLLIALHIQLGECQILRRPIGRRIVYRVVHQVAGHRDTAVGNGYRYRIHRRIILLSSLRQGIDVTRFDARKGHLAVFIGLCSLLFDVVRAGLAAFRIMILVRQREFHALHRRIIERIQLIESQIVEVFIVVGTDHRHRRAGPCHLFMRDGHSHALADERLAVQACARPGDARRLVVGVFRQCIGTRLQGQIDRPVIGRAERLHAGIRHTGFRIADASSNAEADARRHFGRVAHVALDQLKHAILHGVGVGHRRVGRLIAPDLCRAAVVHMQRVALDLRGVALLQQRVGAQRQLHARLPVVGVGQFQLGNFLAMLIQHKDCIGLRIGQRLQSVAHAAAEGLGHLQPARLLLIRILDCHRDLRILGDGKGVILVQLPVVHKEACIQVIAVHLRFRAFLHLVEANRKACQYRFGPPALFSIVDDV